MGNYAEAATAVEQLIAKYPDAKIGPRLWSSSPIYHRRAGHIEAVKATLREAMKLDPGDGESPSSAWSTCSRATSASSTTPFGSCATRARKSPTIPIYDLTLADLLTKYGRNDEAIKLFEDMLEAHSPTTTRRRERSYARACRSST